MTDAEFLDMAAIHAMNAILLNVGVIVENANEIPTVSYRFAHAMLAERKNHIKHTELGDKVICLYPNEQPEK